jgi:hypothetical protein
MCNSFVRNEQDRNGIVSRVRDIRTDDKDSADRSERDATADRCTSPSNVHNSSLRCDAYSCIDRRPIVDKRVTRARASSVDSSYFAECCDILGRFVFRRNTSFGVSVTRTRAAHDHFVECIVILGRRLLSRVEIVVAECV